MPFDSTKIKVADSSVSFSSSTSAETGTEATNITIITKEESFVRARLASSIMMGSKINNQNDHQTDESSLPNYQKEELSSTLSKIPQNNNNNNNIVMAHSAQSNWNLIDEKVSSAMQTEGMDSMRKLKLLFGEVIDSIHHEMYESEKLAREKLKEWEMVRRMGIWRWDATLDVVRDGESRARESLVEAEKMWREEFFQDVFHLEMMDLDLGAGVLMEAHSSCVF